MCTTTLGCKLTQKLINALKEGNCLFRQPHMNESFRLSGYTIRIPCHHAFYGNVIHYPSWFYIKTSLSLHVHLNYREDTSKGTISLQTPVSHLHWNQIYKMRFVHDCSDRICENHPVFTETSCRYRPTCRILNGDINAKTNILNPDVWHMSDRKCVEYDCTVWWIGKN